MKELVKEISNKIKQDLIHLSEFIYNNPEPGNEEFKACKEHVNMLEKHGFCVKREYLELKTAFKAVYDSGKSGPSIAFLAEYDALPGIGHACGHNLLGATSTGAGIVLSKVMTKLDLPGKVIVFGTPAEETNGAKVEMTNKRAFDDIDIALEAHPEARYIASGASLAMEALEFSFKGKSSHASAAPEKGINALDAVIQTFVNINSLRQHILPCSRIHGIIKEGGKAANIVPDSSIAQFYVRATTKTYLKELVNKVKNCAEASALATGASLTIRNYETSYDNLVSNKVLSKLFNKRLKDMGVKDIVEQEEKSGSLDIGNISHIVPTIHPYFGISDKDIYAHTIEFAEATRTETAYNSMMTTICALTLTAFDILNDQGILARIKEEFENTIK